jgi:hypothetical protein
MTNLPKGVIFGHINVCGILSKIDQLKIILRKQFFDIFAVTESKLDHNIDIPIQNLRYFLEFSLHPIHNGPGLSCISPDRIKYKNQMIGIVLTFLQ